MAALGDEPDPRHGHPLGRHSLDVPAREGDGAGDRRDQAGNRADERRFPRAVGADHGDDLAPAEVERDVVQHVRLAVCDVEVLDAQQRAGERTTVHRRTSGVPR
jgi:hypothetical protein